MKKNNKIIAMCLFVLGFLQIRSQTQTISPGIFGENVWFTDRNSAGYFDNRWGLIGTGARGSGVRYLRIGGIEANFRPLYTFGTNLSITNADPLFHIIDSARANGMEPMVQVGYNPVCSTTLNDPLNPLQGYLPDDQAKIAANLVTYIKNHYTSTNRPSVKYWIISNEPNLDLKCNTPNGPAGGFGYNNTNVAASQIAPYIKNFASKMKYNDPTIKIIGPEWTGWDKKVMLDLTTPGGPYDITGKDGNGNFYIDVFSIHYYPFGGDQTRDGIITNLTSPDHLRDHLATLSGRVDTANQYYNRYAGD